MDNLNTPEFWDTQFKLEYKAWTNNQQSHVRWLPTKFLNVMAEMPEPILGAPLKVLDIGCGLGHFCRYLSARCPWGYLTYGTDFSPYAVAKAAEWDDLSDYRVAEVYTQPYPDHYFDVVSAQDVIEHLSDVPAFLKELDRLLKPGGTILIATPERKADGTFHSEEHVQEFTRNGLINLFKEMCAEHFFTAAYVQVEPDGSGALYDPTIYYAGRKHGA
jgi:2-polyprenyl-3-methyl-5-hydroxy-6-metoxy-1,4-benzoquinol methylase